MPRATGYLQNALDVKALRKTVARIVKVIPKGTEAIAVRGASGMLVGGAVSMVTQIPLLLIRKKEHDTHSFREVETFANSAEKYKSWVILDDFIATGRTVDKIIDAVFESGLTVAPKPEAIILYDTAREAPYDGIKVINID